MFLQVVVGLCPFFPCRLYGLLNLLYSGINTSEILPHSLDTNNVITTLHFGNCGAFNNKQDPGGSMS